MNVLESERISFRRITQNDFSELKEMLADSRVMYAWEHTFSDEQITDWIETQLKYYQYDCVGYFAAILKENNKFIGQMGLHRSGLNGKHVFEVCYMLKQRYWHKGYALEGVNALTNYASTVMKIAKIYAYIKASNKDSIAVAEKAGFCKEGSFIMHYNGKDMEHFVYSKVNLHRSN